MYFVYNFDTNETEKMHGETTLRHIWYIMRHFWCFLIHTAMPWCLIQ